ncbi:hypothetical protein CHS0354_010785 [Potamilus streckersoni]|uniref:Ubiquitin-like domain-containing protein n=1 Tax=Potamilus streckersoni TaxID=2493646 RepID=A0AAE0WA79_9BIVA|nr:hypothetical protein CHS0354_010785 [Potamilus streckersoni]
MSSDIYEIVFSFDTTGSMYSCLEEVRKSLGDMVQQLNSKIPGIRIAIFSHGDYGDESCFGYLTKYVNFTNNAGELCSYVRNVGETGGHGLAVYELVMRQVQENLSWTTGSNRALVLIGDTLPHEANDGENSRRLDWKTEVARLRDMNVKIYAIQCGNSGYGDTTSFFRYIASRSFGYYMPLSNISQVSQLLLDICFREAGLAHLHSGKSPEPMISFRGSCSKDSKVVVSTPSAGFDMKAEGLICEKCGEGKLSEEFPPTTITDVCNHPPSICLRCVVEHARKHNECPHEECSQSVDDNSDQLLLFEAILDEMFLDYNKILEENLRAIHPDGDVIYVSTLTGDTEVIQYNASMTIMKLKEKVQSKFHIDPKDQTLLYNEKRLKVRNGFGQPYTLSNFSVAKNSTIYILVPLYRVSEDLNHVVFDLSWGFPETHPDFLDASCFVFQQSEFTQLIDWNHPTDDFYLKGAVKHTQEITTSGGSTGHQKIDVHLKRLPSSITHIFFTLSSWKSPNLSAFSNPSLKFFDAREIDRDLCETTIMHALNSPAVIMCSIVRTGKEWLILEYGPEALVDGNAKQYNPIRQKIEELIKESYDI